MPHDRTTCLWDATLDPLVIARLNLLWSRDRSNRSRHRSSSVVPYVSELEHLTRFHGASPPKRPCNTFCGWRFDQSVNHLAVISI